MPTADVSLVIPGRDCAATLGACLGAVVPMLDDRASRLREIVFVDDGSRDGTAEIAASFPVRVVRGPGAGPGAARNLGWRAAVQPLVWFVDADCVAEPDALARLVPHLDDPAVAAVSGSYGIMNPESRLARLIHEEIVQRHLAMPESVDFLATFNVLYRRGVLESLDGFDERYLKAQDAELSFRVKEAGHALHFERSSRVRHYHETRLGRYLRTQRRQGYWRVWLHLEHAGHARGDSYSSLLDHVQPPLALAAAASLPALAWPWLRLAPAALAVLLLLAQVPMTARIVRRTRRAGDLLFAPMSAVRAVWRGVGLAQGVVARLAARRASRPRPGAHDRAGGGA